MKILASPTKPNPSLPRSVGCKRQLWRLRWALVRLSGLVTRDAFYNDFENNNRRTHSGQQSLVSSPANEDFKEIYVYDKAVTCLWHCNDETNKNQKPKTKTINKAITISTYNVRTLKRLGKLNQLIHGCNDNNIDLVAVQEHRWQTHGQTGTYIRDWT